MLVLRCGDPRNSLWHVLMQDGGSETRRSATTSLRVLVDDVTVAPPTFTETVYTFEVAEGSHSNVC